MTPFVLLGRKKLPPETKPSPEEVYDDDRQLWVDKSSGVPLVLRMQGHERASSYGETTMTETREGVDQSEGAAIHVFDASPFGETTITKTQEGADQAEGGTSLEASSYGETVQTRTREGVDQPESSAL